jgi:hypothetical protein
MFPVTDKDTFADFGKRRTGDPAWFHQEGMLKRWPMCVIYTWKLGLLAGALMGQMQAEAQMMTCPDASAIYHVTSLSRCIAWRSGAINDACK